MKKLKWRRDRKNHVELLCGQCGKLVGLGIDEYDWSDSHIEWNLLEGWKESNGDVNAIRCQNCRESSKDEYIYTVIGCVRGNYTGGILGIYDTMAEARKAAEGLRCDRDRRLEGIVVRWGRTSV